MESLPLGADDCSKAQCARFTLPGQVWSISTKFRERSNGHEEAFTVIEFSEDLTKYIGFTPSKSKYVWLQFQSGFDVSAGFEGAGMSNNDISVHQQRNYFNYLVEGELSETNKDLGQGPMYTVRSIMNNSIELYEDYLGPQVLEGYPLVQLRIGWPDHGGMVDLNPSPRNIDSITPVPQMHRFPQHCSRINVGDTTAPQTKLSSLVAHPRLPYVMCGFSNGDIRLISPHFK